VGRRARPVVVENEKPDCRGQVVVLAIPVDLAYKLCQRRPVEGGDLLHRVPEADAGLMTSNDDRAFDDRCFHCASSREGLLRASGCQSTVSVDGGSIPAHNVVRKRPRARQN